MTELEMLERELCEHLDFGNREDFTSIDYSQAAKQYGVDELENDHEKRLCKEYGNVVLLKHFPYHTSPFWNMKRNGDVANKIDVLINGMETIGSAERSSDPSEMWKQFHTISDGGYAGLLFSKFGRERVLTELEQFLGHDFFPRFGGGIGLTRLISAII